MPTVFSPSVSPVAGNMIVHGTIEALHDMVSYEAKVFVRFSVALNAAKALMTQLLLLTPTRFCDRQYSAIQERLEALGREPGYLTPGPISGSFAEGILDATVHLSTVTDESNYLTIEIVLNLILPAAMVLWWQLARA